MHEPLQIALESSTLNVLRIVDFPSAKKHEIGGEKLVEIDRDKRRKGDPLNA